MFLLTIITLVVCVLLLYIRLRLNNTTTALDKIIILTTGMILFQVTFVFFASKFLMCCRYLDALAPFRLIYPPVLYLIVQLCNKNYLTVSKKQFYLHASPILLFLMQYALLSFSASLRAHYGPIAFKLLLMAEIVSTLLYSTWCVIILYKPSRNAKMQASIKTGLELAVTLSILTGSFSMIRYFEINFVDISKYGRNNLYSLILLLVISTLLFLLTIEQWKSVLETTTKTPSKEPKIQKLPVRKTKDTSDVLPLDPEEIEEQEMLIGTAKEIYPFLEKLYQLEDAHWFLNPEVNLHALAKETKTTKAFVSKILNVRFEMNFNQYVNSIRVKYVVDVIHKQAEREADFSSIEDLYIEAGFKSKSTFNRHFRRIMSQTPTEFIDAIKKTEQ